MTEIFVFGSNREGRHGKGAALTARRKHGAVNGIGEGMSGNSYAIPTKELRSYREPVTLAHISESVEDFKNYAKSHKQFTFNVTKLGTGLAGFKESEIGPLFVGSGPNVRLPPDWEKYR